MITDFKIPQFAAAGCPVRQRLMADFFRRVYAISKHSGVAFILVDAKDEDAAEYYESLLFVRSKHNPLRLVLSTATIIQEMRAQEQAFAKPI
ncbi:hypothetical protein [Pseudomonas savastanoi]